MHYLRKEFNRLVKYAEGLGIKVTCIKATSSDGNAAEWSTDGSQITIYKADTKPPLKLVLNMLHELSHHMAWIHNGRKGDLKTDKILNKEDAGLELTELQRKHLYEMEKSDYEYQLLIHHEVGSKIPLWRLKAEIELDEWIYKYYWKNNKWPLMKDQTVKRKELLNKHKG